MNLLNFQKRIKITFLSFILFSLFIVMNISCSAQEGKNNDKAIEIAESFLSLHPDTVAYKSEAKSYKWNYEQGLMLEGFYQLWKSTGDKKYFDYIKKNIDYYVENNGNIKTYKLEDYNLDNVEKSIIRKVISKHGGNISVAAKELGLTRTSLYRRLEKYGL